ncbi:hypothetical protein ACHHYP_14234 [Achlya hypogyna]|uniref:TOG domain-containing protein n=1 Tax=Achlya hypogyna TaxID=1202772 RepID=A0A1V9YDL8_ACHHY|nr:hypothetical protein ACHHYP_14234 [Achlya hypogyna]
MKRRSTGEDEARARKLRPPPSTMTDDRPTTEETLPPTPVEPAPQDETIVTKNTKDSGAPDNEDDLADFVVLSKEELEEPARNFTWSPGATSWKDKYSAVETLRQTIKFDPAYVQGYEHLLEVAKELLVPSAMNLRSTLARNALLCIGELFQCVRTQPYLPVLVPVLLYRSITDKKFMQSVATTALDHALASCDPIDLLEQLLPFSTDKNAHLVTKAGHYVEQCLIKSAAAEQPWEAAQLVSWIKDLANFLNCRDVHGKPAAKRCLILLRKTFGDATFEATVAAELSGITRSDVLKLSVAPTASRGSSIVRPHPGQKKGRLATRPGLSLKDRLLQAKQQQALNPQE